MKGSWKQASDYATKNGKAFEEGEQISAGRGTRSDLTELAKNY